MKKIIVLIGVCVLCPLIISTPFRRFMNENIGGFGENRAKQSVEAVEVDEQLTKLDIKTEADVVELIALEQLTGDLIISNPGEYQLSGTALNKKIVIDLEEDENIHLFLDSVEIKSQNGPVIYVNNAGKVVITLNGENSLKDDAGYEGENKACIYSNVDLTINGSGCLYVYGYNHDGIRSKDCVKIIGSQIYVQAKNNGIRGNDGVILKDCIVDIQSEGTGIKSVSDKDYVIIQGGQCNVIAGENVITSEKQVTIKDCLINMYSVKENIKCNGVIDIEEYNP